jgi:hypothetical protein
MRADVSLTPWRQEARKHGYASCIALPLLLNGEVLEVLVAAEASSMESGNSTVCT